MASFMQHIHRDNTTLPPPAPAARCILSDCQRTDDLTTVYHGATEPAIACGFHAHYFLTAVAAAHNAMLGATP